MGNDGDGGGRGDGGDDGGGGDGYRGGVGEVMVVQGEGGDEGVWRS